MIPSHDGLISSSHTLKNKALRGVLCWPSGLRSWHSHCSGSGCCCGVGLIPGLRISACSGPGQKNKESFSKIIYSCGIVINFVLQQSSRHGLAYTFIPQFPYSSSQSLGVRLAYIEAVGSSRGLESWALLLPHVFSCPVCANKQAKPEAGSTGAAGGGAPPIPLRVYLAPTWSTRELPTKQGRYRKSTDRA